MKGIHINFGIKPGPNGIVYSPHDSAVFDGDGKELKCVKAINIRHEANGRIVATLDVIVGKITSGPHPTASPPPSEGTQ